MEYRTPLSPVSVFYSYAHKDERYRQHMETCLSTLKRQGLIVTWHDRNISAGTEWTHEIDSHLNTADLILLLISPDFIASEYCYSIEMTRAMERHTVGEARVIPIILRPTDWKGAPFSKLQVLPKDGQSVTEWPNRDKAFLDIANGIRKAIEELVPTLSGASTSSSSTWNVPHRHIPHLVDIYLKNVVATTRQLPWGYLPGDFTSELEIDDVYVLPHLSSKEHRRISVDDEWLERELLRQLGQGQEKKENKRRTFSSAEKPSYSSLYELVQSGVNATLVGYMGSGKSMASSYIALQLAKGEGQSIFGLSKPKIPILLRLGRMRETPASDLITFAIENAVANLDHATALKDILRQEWETGNVLFILDALDEFRGEMQWISDEIVRLSNRDLHGSSILLTSRPSVYRSLRTVGLKAFTLEELQREEIFEFVETWTKAFLKITRRTDLNARDHAKSLTNEIGRYSLEEIASNQLLLTILTILSLRPEGIRFDKERVTEARLLDAYVTYLIEWEISKGAEAPKKYGTDLLRIVFSYTGFEAQRAQSGMFGGLCTYSSLLHTLPELKYLKSLSNPRADTEAILKFWLNTGLIQQIDDEAQSVRFRHQAFQYLGAALAMTYQSEERSAKILADVETNREWADVRRLYIGLQAHLPSPLE